MSRSNVSNGTTLDALLDEIPETSDTIDVTDIHLPAVTPLAIAALEKANATPILFRQLANLVRVQLDEAGQPIIKPATVTVMRHHMARAVDWCRTRGSGKREYRAYCEPPISVVEDVLETPELPFPALRGITTSPFFNERGHLVIRPGYDPVSKLYLVLDNDVQVPTIPRAPNAEQVAAAKSTIDDLFEDFPFVDLAGRAHAFALLLLPFVREMISGPTPQHLVGAPKEGTGKTLLVQVALFPSSGNVQLDALSTKEEEREKQIMALLLAGRSAIVFDNVEGKLDSAKLAGTLTSTQCGGRVLGASLNVKVPNRATWVVTSNNASISTEIARRSVPIRLDAQIERPFEREIVYRHPEILKYEQEHRGEIIAAALTILQAWIANGRPAAKRKLGTFEAWSDVIGGALAFVGIAGFLENIDDLLKNANEDGALFRVFVESWADEHGEKYVKAAELLPLSEQLGITGAVGDDDKKGQAQEARKLGMLLSKNRDAFFGTHRVEREQKPRNDGLHWRVTTARRPPPAAPIDERASAESVDCVECEDFGGPPACKNTSASTSAPAGGDEKSSQSTLVHTSLPARNAEDSRL